MESEAKDVVLIPHAVSPSGVGIGFRESIELLVLLCPDCGSWLTYKDSSGPEMTCSSWRGVKSCKEIRTEFPGILSSSLAWTGSMKQICSIWGREEDPVKWIEMWTGCTDVQIKIHE